MKKIKLEENLFVSRMPDGLLALTREVDGEVTDLIYLDQNLLTLIIEWSFYERMATR
jgi:hypothetical protein